MSEGGLGEAIDRALEQAGLRAGGAGGTTAYVQQEAEPSAVDADGDGDGD